MELNKAREILEAYISIKQLNAAELYIKSNKLPFKIVNDRLVDISDKTEDYLNQFITFHPQMLELKDDARKLSKINDEVLIMGPTGTGKELIARALHGARPERKFKAINCAGLPENLIESELFGHVRGAFTDARKDKVGLMSLASSDDNYKAGTFFLDEIGELPMLAQAKLLRALQEKKIRRVGGEEDEEIDCRIVCATNKNIADMCKNGLFRTDLYARIGTFELNTIGLDNRVLDIEPIANSIPGGKEWYSKWKEGKDHHYFEYFPFNVRSLQAMIKRYKILGKI